MAEISKLNKSTKSRDFKKKKKKGGTVKSLNARYEGREMVFNIFKS